MKTLKLLLIPAILLLSCFMIGTIVNAATYPAWNSASSYYKDAVVSYNGQDYICLNAVEANSWNVPESSTWYWQPYSGTVTPVTSGYYAIGITQQLPNNGGEITLNGSSYILTYLASQNLSGINYYIYTVDQFDYDSIAGISYSGNTILNDNGSNYGISSGTSYAKSPYTYNGTNYNLFLLTASLQPAVPQTGYAIGVTQQLKIGDNLIIHDAMGNKVASYNVIESLGSYQGYYVYSISLVYGTYTALNDIESGEILWDNNSTEIASSSFSSQQYTYNGGTYTLMIPSATSMTSQTFYFAVVLNDDPDGNLQSATYGTITSIQVKYKDGTSDTIYPSIANRLPSLTDINNDHLDTSACIWENTVIFGDNTSDSQDIFGLQGGYDVGGNESNITSKFEYNAPSNTEASSLIKSVIINTNEAASMSIEPVYGQASGATPQLLYYAINID